MAKCDKDCLNCIYDDCIITSDNEKRRKYDKAYYERNRDARIAYSKAYQKAHPEKVREQNRKQYLKRKAKKEQRNDLQGIFTYQG